MNFLLQAQLAKVSSTTPYKGRRNVTIRWQEPAAAKLVSCSMGQVLVVFRHQYFDNLVFLGTHDVCC